MCGFEQRLQRPEFVRKTKHSGVGHEDIGYSYVVIRRGSRPLFDPSSPNVGKMGPISYEEVQKDMDKRSGLVLYPDTHANQEHIRAQEEDIQTAEMAMEQQVVPETLADVEGELRNHAYHWPRLVFPPLKRSGHIILDSCTPNGGYTTDSRFRLFSQFLFRKNHASDHPQVSGKASVLRC